MADTGTEAARRHFEAGVAKFEDRDYSGAQESFEAALRLAPDRATVLNNLAACLIRTGDHRRALELSRRSATIDPANADAWVNIAASLCAEKKFGEAREAAKKALALSPRDSDAWYHVGYCCFALGEAREALRAYDKALERNPDLMEAMFGIATVLATLKHRHAALLCYDRCLQIDPTHAQAHFSRATLLQELLRNELAIAAYKEALRHGHPDEQGIRYSLASMGEGEMPSRPPASYVKRLFDSYAPNFEGHLVQTLKYNTPELIGGALASRGIRRARFLDLGCGTGLVGKAVSDRCRRLIGVDLSERMLDVARGKACYDELLAEDLVDYLHRTDERFDVVCAADVLNYFGDLKVVLDATIAVLDDGGLFVFTVEDSPDEAQQDDFVLRSTRRYTHTKAYCERVARASGFASIESTSVALRMESGIPVTATSFVLTKP